MNAVEIEEAISQLADQPFDPESFPFAFLEAFGNKETTIRRLRAGASNKSDLGGVLQTNNIHIATCGSGQVTKTLTSLKDSPATVKAKAKFILATDGMDFEAEELASGETVACAYKDFPDHFGFFLPLAGITTVRHWLNICPPTATTVKLQADDLFSTPLDQAQIDFENEGGETYICGNPPYVWSNDQSPVQKEDMAALFSTELRSWKTLNYVSAWFLKCSDYMRIGAAECALVSTNTICQGQNNSLLWPILYRKGCEIGFAHISFKWRNLASKNAGVTVVIVGLRLKANKEKKLFWVEPGDIQGMKLVKNISSYLTATDNIVVAKHTSPVSALPEMKFGNKPVDGGNLILSRQEFEHAEIPATLRQSIVRRIYGAAEVIEGIVRYCLWMPDADARKYANCPEVLRRIEAVAEIRKKSSDFGEKSRNHRPHQFREMRFGSNQTVALPSVSSENREYLPVSLLDANSVISNRNYGIYDAPLWTLAVLASRLHWVWADTVCGKLELRFSYTNALGWNAFPIPTLTDKNKEDLTRCAEDILLAREHHFPATIADLYDPDAIPDDLRHAHNCNDEVLERIYIGRLFKNDTERLEKLFDLYTKMTVAARGPVRKRKAEAHA